MIRHVVLIAWADDATDEQKKRVAAELGTLPPRLAGLRRYEFGPNAQIVDGGYDFAVVADFDDAQSYLAYRDHPAHRAIIEQAINPIACHRAAIQYRI